MLRTTILRTALRGFVLPALLGSLLVLGGCGDDTDTATGGNTAAEGANESGAETGPIPTATDFPRFDDLTEDTARALLHAGVEDLGYTFTSRQLLLYLTELDDRKAVNPIHAELLVMSDGSYDDYELAALGLEGLSRYGESDIDTKILALAELSLEEDEATEFMVHALARVETDAGTALLERAARESDDDEIARLAIQELARRRSVGSAELFHEFALSEDYEDLVRGAAFAGLVVVEDPRVDQVLPVVIDEEQVTLVDEVFAGMGIPGLTELEPVMRRMLDGLAAIDSVGFAPDEVATALSLIHGGMTPDGTLRFLHELEHEERYEATPEIVALARWSLGDDTGREAAREILRKAVVRAQQGQNTDDGVHVLEVLARRGAARTPAWLPLVSAAAQVRPETTVHENLVENTDALNLAAANAFLKSGE